MWEQSRFSRSGRKSSGDHRRGRRICEERRVAVRLTPLISCNHIEAASNRYIETSAKSGKNVEEVSIDACERLQSRLTHAEQAFATTAIQIHERIEQNKLKSSQQRKGSSFPINSLAQGAGDKISGCC